MKLKDILQIMKGEYIFNMYHRWAYYGVSWIEKKLFKNYYLAWLEENKRWEKWNYKIQNRISEVE